MGNYLYNDFELPALPDWDRKTYPYASIVRYGTGEDSYVFSVHSGKMYYSNPYSSGIKYYNCVYADTGYNSYYSLKDGKWVNYHSGWTTASLLSYSESSAGTTNSGQVIWTNTDVTWKGGSYNGQLYFAGSEPIPLLPTVSSLTPASLMTGWYAGRRIALMHQHKTR